MITHWSMYDLAFHFIQDFYGASCPQETKEKVLDEIVDLLYRGFTSGEIARRWKTYRREYPGSIPDFQTLYAKDPEEENLLTPDKMYYHNALILIPPPPKRTFDPESGEIHKENHPYFLEIRASFTIRELVEYYVRSFSLTPDEEDLHQYEGAMKWLLKYHDVEQILFMIDVAANLCRSEDLEPIPPVRLREYRRDAENIRLTKITELRAMGEERIVPRKRALR